MQTLLVVAVVAVGALSSTAGARDPQPEHGFDAATFYPLWSGDADTTLPANASGDVRNVTRVLDVPFDDPPLAVETWNAADLTDFPTGDVWTSIHPPHATLVDGVLVRDAYIETFAINPSTVARLTRNEPPRYVGESGRVLATLDYRVALPAGTNESSWSVVEHDVERVRLQVDGTTAAATAGTRTPSLSFEGLAVGAHTLTVVATIRVRVEEYACGEDAACATARVLDSAVETVTVSDSIAVLRPDFAPTAVRLVDADGSVALAVSSVTPWAGLTTSEGRAQGVWAVYSARDPEWDTLVASTAVGETTRASPLTPLMVSAYPRASGPSADGRLTLHASVGVETASPSLPANVSLDTPERYTASTTLVLEDVPTTTMTVRSLVRGQTATLDTDALPVVERRASTLMLERVASTRETVTLQVRLMDTETGAPLDTGVVGGTLTLDGEPIATDTNGTATVTLPRAGGAHTARYTPVAWWNTTTDTVYAASDDVVYVRDTPLDLLGILAGIGIPVGLLVVAGFLVERITGWRFLRGAR
ncbi:hypothetical protein [Halarchaeum sp. P4]|uniref:hypothetical protein n=1 Tax=Halarchaeum sp. P4 TaxID=3421639 RepID=UPI003EB702ED